MLRVVTFASRILFLRDHQSAFRSLNEQHDALNSGALVDPMIAFNSASSINYPLRFTLNVTSELSQYNAVFYPVVFRIGQLTKSPLLRTNALLIVVTSICWSR